MFKKLLIFKSLVEGFLIDFINISKCELELMKCSRDLNYANHISGYPYAGDYPSNIQWVLVWTEDLGLEIGEPAWLEMIHRSQNTRAKEILSLTNAKFRTYSEF